MEAFDLDYFLRLAPEWRGRAEYFPTIGSTNKEGRSRLQPPHPPREWLLVTDKQTQGRGRLSRSWEAPFASGLLCTLTVPLAPLPLDRAYLYTASLALSIKEAVLQEGGVELDLKWPNDLVREGRKCCGILAELEQAAGGAPWLVLGFGLNTNLTARDLAEAGLTHKATNATPLDGSPLPREAALAAIVTAFTRYRTQLAAQPETVRQEWAERLITVGQEVQVLDMNGQVSIRGVATGVDPSGALVVEDENGKRQQVQAGDVSIRLADGRYA